MSMFERISCRNFVEVDGYAYFSNWFYNGMYKVEIKTGKTTFLGRFEGERLCEINIHDEIFLRDGKIYFCPRRGGHVHIYNLAKQSQCSVSIRKSDKEFFVTDNVLLENSDVYFIPRQNNISVRKLNLKSLRVTEESKPFNILRKYVSENKDVFPYPEIIEKYRIECAEFFSWNQIHSKIWYGFLPLGCQLLKYTEGENRIEKIPLTVINGEVLNEYLRKVREDAFNEKLIMEDKYKLNVQDFLDRIKIPEAFKSERLNGNCHIGGKIWDLLCDNLRS